MQKYLFPFFIIGLLLIHSHCFATGTIVWETNFNSIPDWHSKETLTSEGGPSSVDIPDGFANYSTGHQVLPSLGRPILNVDNTNDHQGNGKALTGIVEQAYSLAGGRICVWLGATGYDEIYYRYWEKYESDFKWATAAAPYGMLRKLFRVLCNIDSVDIAGGNPTDMTATPHSRPDWDVFTNNLPWGAWTTYSMGTTYYGYRYYTLNGDLTSGSTSVVVNESLGTSQAKGFLMIDSEVIYYQTQNSGTKTYSTLTRGIAGTTAASHTSGASITQVDTGYWGFNSSLAGGKQAVAMLSMGRSTTTGQLPGLSLAVLDPEGSPGDLIDIGVTFDNNAVWYWKDNFATYVAGAYPWSYNQSGDWRGDGLWHLCEVHLKMNSIVDGVPQTDFLMEWFVDGVKQAQVSNIAFRKTIQTKWNFIQMMENYEDNIFGSGTVSDPPTSEQTIAQDDIVIYTPMSGSEAACGGSCISGRLPLSYVPGESVAGTQFTIGGGPLTIRPGSGGPLSVQLP